MRIMQHYVKQSYINCYAINNTLVTNKSCFKKTMKQNLVLENGRIRISKLDKRAYNLVYIN